MGVPRLCASQNAKRSQADEALGQCPTLVRGMAAYMGGQQNPDSKWVQGPPDNPKAVHGSVHAQHNAYNVKWSGFSVTDTHRNVTILMGHAGTVYEEYTTQALWQLRVRGRQQQTEHQQAMPRTGGQALESWESLQPNPRLPIEQSRHAGGARPPLSTHGAHGRNGSCGHGDPG